MDQIKVKLPERDKMIKTVRHIVLLLVVAVAMEIFVFNFRSIQSLFYQESSYKDYDYEIEGMIAYDNDVYSLQTEGNHIVRINNVNQEIKNIKIDIEILNSIPLFYLEDGVCKVDYYIRDEGNAIPCHINARSILYNNETSKYTWVQLFGNMKGIDLELSLENGYLIRIHDITFNARRPLLFSWIRCLLVFTILLIGYGLRPRSILWKSDCIRLRRWQWGIAALTGIGIISLFWFMISENDTITYNDKFEHYIELSKALDAGVPYLLETPSEELVSMENPYDMFMRYEIGENENWDYAYYDGKFYVYFGILPCLLFYWPVYHFLGLGMPNTIPILFDSILFGIGLFMLFKEIIRQYFKKTPFAVLLLLAAAGFFGCQIPEFINSPAVYAVPTTMAMALTIWGLYFWIAAAENEDKLYIGKLLAGSACMALVAACRPNMVIYSFLAIPIFWRYLKKKYAVRNIFLLLLPYLFVAPGLMYYNAIRFGSVFDFGNTYNLTVVDLIHNPFSLDKVVLAVKYYLLRLPRFDGCFPFLTYAENEANPLHHSAVYIEQIYAGLLVANPVLWSIISLASKKNRMKEKRMVSFCGVALICAVFSMLLTAQIGGIVYRYMADFSFAFFLAAGIAVCILLKQTEGKESEAIVRRMVIVASLVSVIFHLNILFIPSKDFPLSDGNTELFYRIFYGFNFW
ncbi:MAG: hypothetical protein ACI4DW_01360 [Lachnospiraceae bacterium]